MTRNTRDALRFADELERQVRHGGRVDGLAAAQTIRSLVSVVEALTYQRDLTQAQFKRTIKILSSIHMLLYPPPTELQDGRTLVFRPRTQDANAFMQAISDRIRSIPDEIEAAHATSAATNEVPR